MFDGVDSIDTFENVLDRIVYRVLARLDGKTLVTHILKSNDLLTNLILSKLLSGNLLVLHMIGTVYTLINAVIGKVKRSKHNYSVAVEGFLYLACKVVHLLCHLGDITGEKHTCLSV